MQAIDAALPAVDGVSCFNRMYMAVTSNIIAAEQSGTFASSAFLSALDVAFGNLYFAALDKLETGAAPPRAWTSSLRRSLSQRHRAVAVRARRHERAHQPRSAGGPRPDVRRHGDRHGSTEPPGDRLRPRQRRAGGHREDDGGHLFHAAHGEASTAISRVSTTSSQTGASARRGPRRGRTAPPCGTCGLCPP